MPKVMRKVRFLVVSVTVIAGLALSLMAGKSAGKAIIEDEKTVTLAISGMTWGSCADAVQSALESCKGVKAAKVSLEDKEAVVKYDPQQATVDDLIKAVKNAKGMSSYDAKVKKGGKK